MRNILSALTVAVVLAASTATASATATAAPADHAVADHAVAGHAVADRGLSPVSPGSAAGRGAPGADGGGVAASPYVQADSPEEAAAAFEALDTGDMTAMAAIEYGPCTLYPTVMYLRASSSYGAVGAKPYTRCTVPVTSIRHSTDLRYKSFIWWRKATTKTGGNSGVASYTQRNVEYYCVSRESTGWSGTTAGTIVYRGKTYYARVYQPVKTLACGG